MQESSDPKLKPSQAGTNKGKKADEASVEEANSERGRGSQGSPSAEATRQDDVASIGAAEPELIPTTASGAEVPAAQSRQSIDWSEFTPMLELMRMPSDRRIVSARIGPMQGEIRIDTNNKIRTKIPLSLHRSLVLPTTIKNFGSTQELFFSIQALLKKHVPMPTRSQSLITYWALATWFPEFLPFIPSLAITGPSSAADSLLQTLVAVCRRPILLAEVSTAALNALPVGELIPTLLIRELQISKRMAALIDASTQPGYLVSNGKEFQQFYCPKCFYVGEQGNGQVRSANTIHIHIGGNAVRPLHRAPTADVVNDFQNRLLTYRLLNRDKVATSNYHVSAFRPEISAIAEVLGAAIVDNAELQGGITQLLQERNEQARVDRAHDQNGIVLRAVLQRCHDNTQEQVFVREIATTANEIYNEEGESIRLSNEAVGHVLKGLGLYSRRLGGVGRGLILDKATQSRVHRLSEAYEVLPPVPVCGFCHALQTART